MAIYMPNSVYIHVPKTGGTWLTEAITASGIPFKKSAYLHHVPSFKEIHNRWVFVAVRHPVSWLTSLYHHRKRNNWNWDHPNAREIDIVCRAYKLEDFIIKVIDHPGIVGRYFDLFIRQYEGYQKLVIGKQENLANDFIAFLKKGGEMFNADAIRNFAPLHTSEISEQFPQRLLEPLFQSEKAFFLKCGYHLQPNLW